MKALYQRWQEYQPTKEQTIWMAIGSMIAVLVAGFGLSGWVTGGSARQMAEEAAAAAHNQLAAAVCAEHFMRASDARARLAKLEQLPFWERDDYVSAGGWGTMPGEKEASGAVAEMCAARLSEQPKT